MAISKFTVIDQLNIDRDGNVSVRMVYGIEEDGVVLNSNFHRTVVAKNIPAAAQMAVVNAHLVQMGQAPVGASDLAWLDEVTGAVKVSTAGKPDRTNRIRLG